MANQNTIQTGERRIEDKIPVLWEEVAWWVNKQIQEWHGRYLASSDEFAAKANDKPCPVDSDLGCGSMLEDLKIWVVVDDLAPVVSKVIVRWHIQPLSRPEITSS
jgi:hypothetical protein